MPDYSFEQRVVAARPYIQRGMVDAALQAHPIYALLKSKGRVTAYEGRDIEVRVMYGKPKGVFYRDYDILPTTPTKILTKAIFEAAQLAVPVVMSGREMIENSGETQQVDLLRTMIDGAKDSARDSVYDGIHSDGTGSGGKGIIGLKAIMPDDPTTGTYGGINRATSTWWRPGAYDISDGDIPGYTTLTKDTVLPILRAVMAKHTAGTAGPDLIVASPEFAEAVHDKLDAMQTVRTEGASASLGFNTIKLNIGGRSVEFFEESGIGSAMPANTAYLIDIDSLALRYHKERNFVSDGQRKPLNQDATVEYMLWMGQLVMDNGRHNAKITV